ncbi:actin, cytoplasmic [Plakobranchus ocellatus]|uniref:Actin, cytoplasmic n=1 Tax=Plakobranchus ocellatus TaxID=259542 RepID=A0AAV4D3N1_9GAST|nr:actin, cytoplasmic [Plakobranchus ocellatus]
MDIDYPPIVVDNGSSTCRAGFAGDDAPMMSVFSNVIGHRRHEIGKEVFNEDMWCVMSKWGIRRNRRKKHFNKLSFVFHRGSGLRLCLARLRYELSKTKYLHGNALVRMRLESTEFWKIYTSANTEFWKNSLFQKPICN